MLEFLSPIKEFFLNLFFPSSCINCQREGDFLCQDCFSLIDVSPNQYCPFCRPPKVVLDGKTCFACKRTKNLDGLWFAAPYQNFIIKRLISQFKYEPYVKSLSKPLSLLIIKHFQMLDQEMSFTGTVLVPVPLTKRKLRQRGFNQSEEIAKELSTFFKIPLVSDVLARIKETSPQIELSGNQRQVNVKGAFFCQKPEIAKNKKIFLVDDVFTTGSTMEECSRVLKGAGAREVWGVAIARE
jgi:ComF family protein